MACWHGYTTFNGDDLKKGQIFTVFNLNFNYVDTISLSNRMDSSRMSNFSIGVQRAWTSQTRQWSEASTIVLPSRLQIR